MQFNVDDITEMPHNLPDLDENGFTPLRAWREKRNMSHMEAARAIGVSVATYYRYEAGMYLNIHKANAIVEITRGEVRYRDLIADFKPEYA